MKKKAKKKSLLRQVVIVCLLYVDMNHAEDKVRWSISKTVHLQEQKPSGLIQRDP